jgi:hypothetical protein
MSQSIIIPSIVAKKLLPNEKVLYTGSYNRNKGNAQLINNINAVMFTASSNISINPEGYNLLNVKTYVISDKINPIHFLDEIYTISSWNTSPTSINRTKVGQIQWVGLYNNDGSTIITNPDVERFIVAGNEGIFEDVTSVIINYLPDLTRFVYFVGKVNPSPPLPVIRNTIIEDSSTPLSDN